MSVQPLEAQPYGSDAFRLEYAPSAHEQSLRDDLHSYLAEYRLQVPKYQYDLALVQVDGKMRVCDRNEYEPLEIKMRRSIQTRKDLWKHTQREEAELEGFLCIEEELSREETGTIVWMSPPGDPNDGYGDYGYVFVGVADHTRYPPVLSMTAHRVETPTLHRFNELASSIAGEDTSWTTPEDFLRSPLVSNTSSQEVARFINAIFSIRDFPDEDTYAKIFKELAPLIDRFISLVKTGSSPQAQQDVLYALENYSLELKKRHGTTGQEKGNIVTLSESPVDHLIARFSFTPPVVAGSCRKTESLRSNPFQLFSVVPSIGGIRNGESENFLCPNCNQESTPPIGDSCPKCYITKEEAVEKGLTTC